ncbi:hypothetical protein KIPB_003173, partial [Kipferlia bialata]
ARSMERERQRERDREREAEREKKERGSRAERERERLERDRERERESDREEDIQPAAGVEVFWGYFWRIVTSDTAPADRKYLALHVLTELVPRLRSEINLCDPSAPVSHNEYDPKAMLSEAASHAVSLLGSDFPVIRLWSLLLLNEASPAVNAQGISQLMGVVGHHLGQEFCVEPLSAGIVATGTLICLNIQHTSMRDIERHDEREERIRQDRIKIEEAARERERDIQRERDKQIEDERMEEMERIEHERAIAMLEKEGVSQRSTRRMVRDRQRERERERNGEGRGTSRTRDRLNSNRRGTSRYERERIEREKARSLKRAERQRERERLRLEEEQRQVVAKIEKEKIEMRDKGKLCNFLFNRCVPLWTRHPSPLVRHECLTLLSRVLSHVQTDVVLVAAARIGDSLYPKVPVLSAHGSVIDPSILPPFRVHSEQLLNPSDINLGLNIDPPTLPADLSDLDDIYSEGMIDDDPRTGEDKPLSQVLHPMHVSLYGCMMELCYDGVSLIAAEATELTQSVQRLAWLHLAETHPFHPTFTGMMGHVFPPLLLASLNILDGIEPEPSLDTEGLPDHHDISAISDLEGELLVPVALTGQILSHCDHDTDKDMVYIRPGHVFDNQMAPPISQIAVALTLSPFSGPVEPSLHTLGETQEALLTRLGHRVLNTCGGIRSTVRALASGPLGTPLTSESIHRMAAAAANICHYRASACPFHGVSVEWGAETPDGERIGMDKESTGYCPLCRRARQAGESTASGLDVLTQSIGALRSANRWAAGGFRGNDGQIEIHPPTLGEEPARVVCFSGDIPIGTSRQGYADYRRMQEYKQRKSRWTRRRDLKRERERDLSKDWQQTQSIMKAKDHTPFPPLSSYSFKNYGYHVRHPSSVFRDIDITTALRASERGVQYWIPPAVLIRSLYHSCYRISDETVMPYHLAPLVSPSATPALTPATLPGLEKETPESVARSISHMQGGDRHRRVAISTSKGRSQSALFPSTTTSTQERGREGERERERGRRDASPGTSSRRGSRERSAQSPRQRNRERERDRSSPRERDRRERGRSREKGRERERDHRTPQSAFGSVGSGDDRGSGRRKGLRLPPTPPRTRGRERERERGSTPSRRDPKRASIFGSRGRAASPRAKSQSARSVSLTLPSEMPAIATYGGVDTYSPLTPCLDHGLALSLHEVPEQFKYIQHRIFRLKHAAKEAGRLEHKYRSLSLTLEDSDRPMMSSSTASPVTPVSSAAVPPGQTGSGQAPSVVEGEGKRDKGERQKGEAQAKGEKEGTNTNILQKVTPDKGEAARQEGDDADETQTKRSDIPFDSMYVLSGDRDSIGVPHDMKWHKHQPWLVSVDTQCAVSIFDTDQMRRVNVISVDTLDDVTPTSMPRGGPYTGHTHLEAAGKRDRNGRHRSRGRGNTSHQTNVKTEALTTCVPLDVDPLCPKCFVQRENVKVNADGPDREALTEAFGESLRHRPPFHATALSLLNETAPSSGLALGSPDGQIRGATTVGTRLRIWSQQAVVGVEDIQIGECEADRFCTLGGDSMGLPSPPSTLPLPPISGVCREGVSPLDPCPQPTQGGDTCTNRCLSPCPCLSQCYECYK